MRQDSLRRILVAAIPLSILALAIAGGVWFVMQKRSWVEANLEKIEARHARLLGLREQGDEVSKARDSASSQMRQYVYDATQDSTQTGNAAQQKIRSILTAAGLQVVSSQVLPVKEERGFERIPLTVTAEGELLALQSALAVLSSQQPAVLLNELDVQVQGALLTANPKQATKLLVRLGLGVLRERQ